MHGTVVRVDKDEVLVDIGYKSEGVIPVAELSIRRNVNPADEVSVGDEIDALVMTKEDAEGRLLLSKKRARFELAWKAIEAAAESGEPVNGRVIEVVKGGLILDLGVRGFLPASLVDIRRVQDLDEFLGKELRCKVIELNRSRNNVVLSRRAVLEDERKEMRQAILDRLNPGDVVEGTISNIVDFGAFVDLDGMDGLIHISELSWSHVNHPSEVLEIGQTVKVKVLDIDRERQRISLGLKQTQSDPWQQVLDNYGENDVVEGRVTKVVTFGAFVEILPGVEGLVHISELANHHVENPREVVSQGDPVNVLILEIDGERRRLSLSLKRVEEGAVPVPRADGGESVHSMPDLKLSEEAFPTSGAAAVERGRRGRDRGCRACGAGRGRGDRRGRVAEAEPPSAEVETARRRGRRGRSGNACRRGRRGRSGERLPMRSSRPRPRQTPRPETEPETDEPAADRARRRGRGRREPRSVAPDRGRDHRWDRSRQDDGARRVSRARRRDGLERRDRPPSARDRRRRPRRDRRAASARRSSARTAVPTARRIARAVFADRERLAWLEGCSIRSSRASTSTWREQLAAARRAAARLRDRGAAALRGRCRGALRQGRRDHRAAALREQRRRVAARRPRRPSAARSREGPTRRLPLRQHRNVRGAGRMGGWRDGRARGGGRPGAVRRFGLVVRARSLRPLRAWPSGW